MGYSSLEPSKRKGSHCSWTKLHKRRLLVLVLKADGLTYCRSTAIITCFSLVLPSNKQPLQHCPHCEQVSVPHSASLWPFPCVLAWVHAAQSVPHSSLITGASGHWLCRERSGVCHNVKPRGNQCPPRPPRYAATPTKSEAGRRRPCGEESRTAQQRSQFPDGSN